MSDRIASARRSGKKRQGHRKRRGESNNQTQAIPNAKATARAAESTAGNVGSAHVAQNGHVGASAVAELRDLKTQLAQKPPTPESISPDHRDDDGSSGEIQIAELSDDVWDAGWDTGFLRTAPAPEASADKD